MTSDSFSFGSYNSAADWGVLCVAYDLFTPPKRPRKLAIPHRSGLYDYGAECWDERVIRLECVLTKCISKAELREIVYALSAKDRLRLWNEPEKYYVGELYDGAEVTDFPEECMREFELSFICEPFAYTETRSVPLSMGVNRVAYGGTAPTPCTMILRNTGSAPVQKIQITAVKKGNGHVRNELF